MTKKFVGRILFSVLIFFVLTFFVFALSNMMKGNAVDAMLAQNPRMTQETYNQLLEERGLNLPIPVRYWKWLSGFLQGNMGTCELYGRPVSEILSERIGPTLILNAAALVLAVVKYSPRYYGCI